MLDIMTYPLIYPSSHNNLYQMMSKLAETNTYIISLDFKNVSIILKFAANTHSLLSIQNLVSNQYPTSLCLQKNCLHNSQLSKL